jgi:hypothetical protein
MEGKVKCGVYMDMGKCWIIYGLYGFGKFIDRKDG